MSSLLLAALLLMVIGAACVLVDFAAMEMGQ